MPSLSVGCYRLDVLAHVVGDEEQKLLFSDELEVPDAALVTGLATGAAALIAERVAHLKEQGDLTDKKGYFLWRLRNDISGGKWQGRVASVIA